MQMQEICDYLLQSTDFALSCAMGINASQFCGVELLYYRHMKYCK